MRLRPYFPVLRALVVLALIGLWQLFTSTGVIDEAVVSSPSETWSQLGQWIQDGSIWSAIGSTVWLFLIGYLVGVGLGILLGFGMGLSATFRAYLGPFVVFFNAIPKFVLIPFFIAWLGFGKGPGILIVLLVILFVAIITVEASVRNIQGDYVDSALMLGARRTDLARDVYIPAVGVWVVSTARLTIGLAFQSAVVAEFFGVGKGLGYYVEQGEQTFATREIFAAIVLIILVAWILDFLLSLVDRRVSRWVPST